MIPISVCIITKNEADNLDKCLAALSKYPFEIVVVDTGSSDNSREIAAHYTDKLYDFTWCDDFSAARNFAISKASHNMILSLDTDEFITDIDLAVLEQSVNQNPKGLGRIELLNYFETNGTLKHQICHLERLFNRKYYQFQSPIHETITPTSSFPITSYDTSIKVDHVGYLGSADKLQAKSERDLKLLLKELSISPDNPYLYFQVAQCYMLTREETTALDYFKLAIAHHPAPEDDYTRILVCNYGNILISHNQPEEALPLLDYYDYYHDNADYLCMVGLLYLHLNQQLKALPEFIKALTAPKRDSLDKRMLSYYIGFIYELFGQKEIARTHYQNCGDLPAALEALERLN